MELFVVLMDNFISIASRHWVLLLDTLFIGNI